MELGQLGEPFRERIPLQYLFLVFIALSEILILFIGIQDLLMEFHVQEGDIELICQIPHLLPDILTKIDLFLFDGLGDNRG